MTNNFRSFSDAARAMNEVRANDSAANIDADTQQTYDGAFVESSEMAKLTVFNAPEKLDMPDPEMAAAAVDLMLRTVFDVTRDTRMLSGVRDLVRDLPPDAIAELAGHDPTCGQALRWAETVLAGVRTPLQWIADHDPRMPKTSIERWLAGPASTLLFVRRDRGRPDQELQAVLASLRDHAMLERIDVEMTTVAQTEDLR